MLKGAREGLHGMQWNSEHITIWSPSYSDDAEGTRIFFGGSAMNSCKTAAYIRP